MTDFQEEFVKDGVMGCVVVTRIHVDADHGKLTAPSHYHFACSSVESVCDHTGVEDALPCGRQNVDISQCVIDAMSYVYRYTDFPPDKLNLDSIDRPIAIYLVFGFGRKFAWYPLCSTNNKLFTMGCACLRDASDFRSGSDYFRRVIDTFVDAI